MSETSKITTEIIDKKRKGRGIDAKVLNPPHRYTESDMLVKHGGYPSFEEYMRSKLEECNEEYFRGAERLMRERLSAA